VSTRVVAGFAFGGEAFVKVATCYEFALLMPLTVESLQQFLEEESSNERALWL